MDQRIWGLFILHYTKVRLIIGCTVASGVVGVVGIIVVVVVVVVVVGVCNRSQMRTSKCTC